jgi:protein phosphatase methylesterase 1
MGGAIAAHACARGLVPNLSGLIVIDVVEGTALAALAGMMRFLRSRPVTFESEEVAALPDKSTSHT